MSRPRQRPTREETRERLLTAAAVVFAAKGIAAASIEDISTAAGFSRGAFYSNFGTKDELVLELLDEDMEASSREMERLWDAAADPESFIRSMESDERQRPGPIGRDGVLHMELLLYALRDPKNRPRVVEQQHRRREITKAMLEQIVEVVGKPYPMTLDEAAKFILALDDGILMNKLIEPEAYSDTQFSDTMIEIHRMWVGPGPEPTN